MNDAPAAEAKLEDMGLRPIAAPPEPRSLYTEPHLSNVESLALIRGRTFFRESTPGSPHSRGEVPCRGTEVQGARRSDAIPCLLAWLPRQEHRSCRDIFDEIEPGA